MYSIVISIFMLIFGLCLADPSDCTLECPPEEMECAFDLDGTSYKLFSSKCAMAAYSSCHNIQFVQTSLEYCMKSKKTSRRWYGESCPAFCPNHYRPVCAASKLRSYIYRTFNNGCYLDMLNCRGDEDISTYIEVPLEFCQKHLMKNIFNEKVVVSGLHNDYEDYER